MIDFNRTYLFEAILPTGGRRFENCLALGHLRFPVFLYCSAHRWLMINKCLVCRFFFGFGPLSKAAALCGKIRHLCKADRWD